MIKEKSKWIKIAAHLFQSGCWIPARRKFCLLLQRKDRRLTFDRSLRKVTSTIFGHQVVCSTWWAACRVPTPLSPSMWGIPHMQEGKPRLGSFSVHCNPSVPSPNLVLENRGTRTGGRTLQDSRKWDLSNCCGEGRNCRNLTPSSPWTEAFQYPWEISWMPPITGKVTYLKDMSCSVQRRKWE